MIEYLVLALVDNTDQVQVNEIVNGDSTTIQVRVAQSDLGKVIGKQGRIANALRTVAKAVAMKQKCKVFVDIDA
jgi:predicted RNA-binding protein YlqC (UPF0109 family)